MSDHYNGRVQVLFVDAVSCFYARPPFLGVYVEKLIMRPHGTLCYTRYNAAETSYLAVFDHRIPKRHSLTL